MTPIKLFVTATTGDSGAPLQEGVAVSSTNTYYSKMWSGQDSGGQSLQLEWTGTPAGALTLWYSNKPNPSEENDADWEEEATVFSPTDPAGSASGFVTENLKLAYRLRLKYVNASGSGVLKGWVQINRV